MPYSLRTYRHRNPKREADQQPDSFFTHAGRGAVQTKKQTPFFQTKLTVGEPGDRYEQEADAVASEVVNTSGAGPAAAATPIQRKKISQVQRLSSSKEDEKLSTNEERMRRDKEIQAKPDIQAMSGPGEKEEDKKVQMKTQEEERDEMKEGAMMQQKPEGGSAQASPPGLSARIGHSVGKGKSLPRNTLAQMNTAFGQDFSPVKVHTDNEAAGMNKDLGAQAFTYGRDIFFNKGKYDPEQQEGKKLLAHELTHVVQQDSTEAESS